MTWQKKTADLVHGLPLVFFGSFKRFLALERTSNYLIFSLLYSQLLFSLFRQPFSLSAAVLGASPQ